MFRSLVLVLAAAAVLAGCSPSQAGGSAAAATPPAENANANATPAPNSGKVLQSQNAAGYTYAEVETAGGKKVWIAASQIEVQPGVVVQWGNAMLMRNFTSKSLGRTFPEILFVDGWAPAGHSTVATSPHGNLPMPQLGATAGADGATSSGVVKSVVNAAGYSYIEADQGGKTVWVAAMETPMKRGDKVQWQGGTQMRNFNAKSLGRTFETIIFAQAVSVEK